MAERLWFSSPSMAQMLSECKSSELFWFIFTSNFWYHSSNIDYCVFKLNCLCTADESLGGLYRNGKV